jgi:hypothetical protein
MTSLPGVLTAVAGLVTAVTGGGLYLSQDDGGGGGSTTVITMTAAPQPEGSAQVNTDNLGEGLPETSADDQVTALVEDCLAGSVASCDELLYELANECYQGYPAGCDDLYFISDPGSAYEDYGATCGGRLEDWAYAGDCIDSGL